MRIRLLVLTACLAVGVSLTGATASAPGSEPNAVIAWNANAGEAVLAACFLGGFAPQEARMYAMMHVAVHDALNAIDRRSRPYAASLNAPPGTSPDAAVAAAARDVLVTVLGSFSFFLPADCINGGIASVEADYAAALAAIPNGPAKSQGVALGQAAAAAILALRSGDGFDTPPIDPNVPGGHGARRVPLHAGHPLRVRPALGRGHSLRAARRFAIPSRATVLADQPQVRRGCQRGSGPRRRRRHHAQRPHGRADGDRPVLGRELAARVEPPHPVGRDRRGNSTSGRAHDCSAC